MRMMRAVAALALAIWPLGQALAQGTISDLPRKETLIVENPEGTIKNAGWFNIWAINAGGQSTGLHQLAMDTFWYIDPQKGIDGVWDNSLASEKPIYNADFTEMTVKLRKGIFWSDGVEFTADDVVYTIQTHMKTNGLRWSAPVQINVAEITAPDPQTVVFKLKKPNSRFHALFTVRWNAMWMMPKHVFEKGRTIAEVRLRSAGDAGRLHAQVLRPQRQVVHLAEARRLAAHDGGALRRARPEVRRLYRSRPAGQARDRAAQPRARHHPRHLARGHVHAGQAVEVVAWLVQGLPLRPSRSDPAGGDLQQPERHVQEPRRALGARPADRHQGGVDGVVSRRGDDLGDRRAADRLGIPKYYHAAAGEPGCRTSRSTPARARSSRTIRRSASRSPTCCGPSLRRPDPDRCRRRSPSRSAAAGGSPTRRRPPSCWSGPASARRATSGHARRQAVRHQADGRGRGPSGDDPRRQHDRAAMAPVRHRRHDRGGAGQHGRPPRRRRLRGDDHLERRDLGRPSRPVVLPRQLALAVRRRSPASRSRRATGSAGAIPSSTRSSSRCAGPASTIPRASSSAATT